MAPFGDYQFALWGIVIIVATLLIQALVGSAVKARQPGAVPGKVDPNLSHHSFVFRAHRTFMNSLENVPVMLATAFLAILAGASAPWTAIFIWTFALARLAHMLLYYVIATEKNPSPRSYFYLIGMISNAALLILSGMALAGNG